MKDERLVVLNQVEMGKMIGGEAAEILVVKKTGSLFRVTPSHGTTNVTLYLIIPFFI